ncbi:flagellar basal body-associated FliL family protein [Rhodanobacter sp. PCA2]|uniref:flagellar basal body-associated FliL family protein n=1 Tax=Rhodanobacter sp. PCA2 TaxID=2006117 RepID=UPI0015E79876|nr:flagellar basal body-associated FliL family protein [Rhodanobacter sp. PCA2]MBA2077200.1 flagellar basal body protein FliL [Rhodanobacter sp. PCA2]
MANEEQTAAEPAARKRGRPLLIGAVALLALAGGGYAWQVRQAAHVAAKAAAPDVKPELYLPMDPPFVVNFRDEESLRYLQVAVTLMSHDPKAIEVAKSVDPAIRDALVSLFSNQEYAVISEDAGRRKLQGQALETVRKVVQARLGRPGIDALYFTSFVMQ